MATRSTTSLSNAAPSGFRLTAMVNFELGSEGGPPPPEPPEPPYPPEPPEPPPPPEPPEPPADTGNIYGIVSDMESAPIMNALVYLNGEVRAVTDEAGSYAIPDIAPGLYMVSATADGYDTTYVQASVIAGCDTIVDIFLPGEKEEGAFPIWPVVGIGAALLGVVLVARR